MEPIKLQKYFSECGLLSRRAAEAEIAAGRVKVNGTVATLGTRVDPDTDVVEYQGKRLTRPRAERICVMLNKPRGYVTTLSDEKGRRTVAELVSDLGRRVYPIGRLDMDSDGLLLLTDDGELANRLTHPRHEIPKIYHVRVRGTVSDAVLDKLRSPMDIDGYVIRPVPTELLSSDPVTGQALLRMELWEGRNRQIRKMCAACSLTVLRLSRVAIGDLTLGELPQGSHRLLTEEELAYLRGTKTPM